jgi:hypothetical protein
VLLSGGAGLLTLSGLGIILGGDAGQQLWVLALMALFTAGLAVRPLLKVRQTQSNLELQQSFQKPLEIAAASALSVHFVLPWMGPWLVGIIF